MFNASRLVHRVAKCPCAHSKHTADGISDMEAVRCATCDHVAVSKGVTLSVVSVETIDEQGLAVGSQVGYNGRPHRVVDAEEITKLGGAIPTGYVMLHLKPVKEST